MSKNFLKGMHPEDGGKTIIVLGKDNGILPDIAKFLTGMHPEDGRLKILGTQDEQLNEGKQPDLSKFLSGMNSEEGGKTIENSGNGNTNGKKPYVNSFLYIEEETNGWEKEKVKKKVSNILD